MAKIVFANWKDKVKTEAGAVELAQQTDAKGIVLCPPHEFLREVAAVTTHAELCVQDYAPDAYARGARYVLVGHADRRAAGDTESIVAEKMALTVADGLIPVLCIGETRAERDSGVTNGVLKRLLLSAFSRLVSNGREMKDVPVCVAYEPLWAISSGPDAEECSPEAAVHRIAWVKEQLLHLGYGVSAKYLYGGSVTGKNVANYSNIKDIDGFLVGAASVKPEELKNIWHSASKS